MQTELKILIVVCIFVYIHFYKLLHSMYLLEFYIIFNDCSLNYFIYTEQFYNWYFKSVNQKTNLIFKYTIFVEFTRIKMILILFFVIYLLINVFELSFISKGIVIFTSVV